MQGWSASGQTFWWHGRQGTWCRRTSDRRDHGRHCASRFVPLKRTTEGGPRAGRQVRRAGVGADEQVGAFEEGGRLGTVIRPVQSRRPRVRLEHRGGVGVLGAADDDDPPAVVEEPARSGPSSAPAASAWPRSRPRGGRRAAGPGHRTGPRAASRARRGDSRRPRDADAAMVAADRDRRAALPGRDRRQTVADRTVTGRVRATPRGASWPTRIRSRSVTCTATRAGPSAGDAQAFEQGQPRADLVAAGNPVGDVGQQEPAPAHRPADPPGDARQGQDEHRQDVAPDVDPEVVALAPERTAQRPDRRAHRPAARGRARTSSASELDAVDAAGRPRTPRGCSARRARRSSPRDRPRGAARGAGWSGPRRPVVELDEQDPPRGRPRRRRGRTQRQGGSPAHRPRRARGRGPATATCCSGSGRAGQAWVASRRPGHRPPPFAGPRSTRG